MKTKHYFTLWLMVINFLAISQPAVTVTIGYPDHEDYFIYSIPPTDEHARFGGEYYFKVENTGTVDLLDWEINTIWKTLNSTWGVVDKTVINASTGEIKLTGPSWDTDLMVGESFVLSGEWISSGTVEDWIDFLPRAIEMNANIGVVQVNYDTNGEVNAGSFMVQKTQPITDDLKSYEDLKIVAYFPIFDAVNAWCSLKRYGENIDQLRVQLYSISPTGQLRAGQDLPSGVDPINDLHYWYDYIDEMGVIDFCVANDIELIPVIYNYNNDINDFDQSAVHNMMINATLKANHINDIVALLSDKPVFAGIDVDYESLMASDKDNYSLFIEDLADEVHNQGKIITTAVHTKVGPGTWYGPQAQDYERIGNAVDEILFMTYDLHWATSPTFNNPPPTAGCQSTPDWINDVAMFAISEIDNPSKIQLGLPFYGYRWKYLFENHDLNDPGVGLTHQDALNLIQEHGVSPSAIQRESNGEEQYFVVEIDGVDWICYYQDEQSLTYKLSALDEYNLRDYIGGVGVWRLGGESDEMWNALMMATKNTNAIINTNQNCHLKMEDVEAEKLTIFPNPVNNQINFGQNTLKNISIYAVNGDLMYQGRIHSNSIDVAYLKPGVYFIRIQEKENTTIHKFIKN